MTHAETSFALTRPIHVTGAHLVVSDLDRVSRFYREIIGLKTLESHASGTVLGVGDTPLLTLSTRGDAVKAPRNAAGLFHNAFLVPSRAALSHWLANTVEKQVPLQGASDHLVSEAIYLADPEGNGIEVYRDRNPQEWTFHADGTVEMATERLNLQKLYDEAPQTPWQGMEDGTGLGHIHLQVGAIPAADAFYRDVLGLKIMARYPGASFFGAGTYHHHVAANIWNSRGAPVRSGEMTGLAAYTLGFNDPAAREAALAAIDRLEIPVTRDDQGYVLNDPAGIGLRLAA